MESQSKWYYLVIIIIVAAAIAGYFYWRGAPKEEQLPEPPKASDPAVSGTLPTLNPQTNILENVPEINPVDKANPFKDVYKNPFE